MGNQETLKKDLVDHCDTLGINAVRSVSLETLEDAEALYRGAQELLPDVRSIISFTRPFPRGAMHLMKDKTRGLPFYSRLAGLGARDIDQSRLISPLGQAWAGSGRMGC
jgi:hypothetical protein